MSKQMVHVAGEPSIRMALAWSEALLQAPDAITMAQVAVKMLPELIPLSACVVCLYPADPGFDWRVISLTDDWASDEAVSAFLTQFRADLTEGASIDYPPASLYQSGQAASSPLEVKGSSPTWQAYPLCTHRSTLGVLLISPTADVLAPNTQLYLQALVAHLSLALENATFYARAAQREREMEIIAETGKQLTQLQSLSELIPQLVREVSQTFNYDSMGLLLVDVTRNDLVVRETFGLEREKHLGFRVPITDHPEGGITGRAAYHGRSYLVPDVLQEKHYIRTVESTRSELTVPLKINERVIGVLDVQSVVPGGLTVKDMQVLTTLADQIAIALDNARLYEELAQAHEQVRQKAEQLQHLLARTVQIQEDERRRIAADIHDSVIQLVYGALYQVEGATQRLPTELTSARTQLQAVRTSLNQAIAETHKAIYDLWPSSLDEMGLLTSVETYLARFEQSTDIRCALHISGPTIRFTPPARISIYRILQEALNNVRKHAQATSVEVRFEFEPDTVRVTIRDDGQGFNREGVKASSGRLGLIAMRERAQSISGAFDIRSGPSGTQIALEFPRDRIQRETDAEH